jgi:hypothetical protein
VLNGVVYGRWWRLRWCVALHAAMNAVWLAAILKGVVVGPGGQRALAKANESTEGIP